MNKERLFHVSEEADISIFHPRAPERTDLDPDIPLVWALCERTLPNFFVPRDCPRVTFHAHAATRAADLCHFSSPTALHCVAVEHAWLDQIRAATLYLYEFDARDFRLQDECAGYYVSTEPQVPLRVHRVDDALGALARAGVEIRLLDNLWPLCDTIQKTTLHWSLCRMRNAQARGITKSTIGGALC